MLKKSLILIFAIVFLIKPTLIRATGQGLNLKNRAEDSLNYIHKVELPFIEKPRGLENRDSIFEIRNSNFGGIRETYLFDNKNSTFTIVDAYPSDNILLLTYDLDFKLINSSKIKKELEKFGAFYKGDDGYYILFGQDNLEEDNSKEVYRIVKYSFDFSRIGSISIKGGESFTTKPFEYSTTRMAQKGKTLIIHTSRIRYRTEDGLNHQSNMTIKINTDSMKATFISDPYPKNMVGHSFNQFVLFDNDIPMYLDHSDGNPSRGMILTRESSKAYFDRTNLLPLYGDFGENYTGASLGGFDMSSNKHIIAGNSIIQNEDYLNNEFRNIFIATLPRGETSSYYSEFIWITNYSESEKIIVYEPKLVKLNEDSFIVLWQEYRKDETIFWYEEYESSVVKYVFLDSNGYPIGDINTISKAVLPLCEPLIIDNNLIWYKVDRENLYFYKFQIDELCAKQKLNADRESLLSQALT